MPLLIIYVSSVCAELAFLITIRYAFSASVK
jgi:hypothetical protein